MTYTSFLLKGFTVACFCMCLSVSQGNASFFEGDDSSYVVSTSSNDSMEYSDSEDEEMEEVSSDDAPPLADLIDSEWDYFPDFNTIHLTNTAIDLFKGRSIHYDGIYIYLLDFLSRHNPQDISLSTFLLNIQREVKKSELCNLKGMFESEPEDNKALKSHINWLYGELTVIKVVLDVTGSPRL